MAMWFYQMNQLEWPPNSYRLDTWERERWAWAVGRKAKASAGSPKPGDRVVFFYARAGGSEPGFCGWALVLDGHEDEGRMYFRPVAPSDHLKMHPWWGDDAKRIADEVRGKVKRATLWKVSDHLARAISVRITG